MRIINGMTNAEYIRHLRKQARAEGKCGECRARPAKYGKATCQVCLDRRYAAVAVKLAKARQGTTLCTTCGDRRRRKGKRTCWSCADRSKRNDASCKARGTCTKCRWPAVPGTTMCQSHHQYNRRKVREWHFERAETHRSKPRSDRKAA